MVNNEGEPVRPDEDSSIEQEMLVANDSVDSASQEPASPIFVEVITEESVEYLVPEQPAVTGDQAPQPVQEEHPVDKSTGSVAHTAPSPESGASQSTIPHPVLENTNGGRPINRPLGTTAPFPPGPSDDKPNS